MVYKNILSNQILPDISKLKAAQEIKINRGNFKIIDYDINLDALDFCQRVDIPKDWHIRINQGTLGQRLPFDWTELYINKYNQNFNPDRFCANAWALCKLKRANPEFNDKLVSLKNELIERLLEYTIIQNNARYVIYKFDLNLYCGLPQPWVSGFAQGQILSGLCYLYKYFNDTKALKIAEEIWSSFIQYRARKTENFWITEIDHNGYFWIEEYPLKNDPQPKVLNGHIWGIYGLYNYYQIKLDISSKQLLQGAITSIHHYVNKYRRQNKINYYDLRTFKPDYYPERTVYQQRDLFTITGEEYFLYTSKLFQEDLDNWQLSLGYKLQKTKEKIKIFLNNIKSWLFN